MNDEPASPKSKPVVVAEVTSSINDNNGSFFNIHWLRPDLLKSGKKLVILDEEGDAD